MKRKLLAILTCICMIMSMIPTYAFAETSGYSDYGLFYSDGEKVQDDVNRFSTDAVNSIIVVVPETDPDKVKHEQMIEEYGEEVGLDQIDEGITITHTTARVEDQDALAYTVSFSENFKGRELWDEGRLSRLRFTLENDDFTQWIEVFDHMHAEGVNAENCAICLEGRLFWFWENETTLNEDGTLDADHGRAELHLELGERDKRGYFAYFNGTGYMPVELAPVTDDSSFVIKKLAGKVYSIDAVAVSEGDTVVKTTIGSDEYSMSLKCVLPDFAIFSSDEEKTGDTYLGEEVLVSELTENKAYIYAPIRMENGQKIAVENVSMERCFFDEEADNVAFEDFEGSIEKTDEKGGSYIWTITFPEGYIGNDIENDGRYNNYKIEVEYEDDTWDRWLTVYDHEHSDRWNCLTCMNTDSKLFFIEGDDITVDYETQEISGDYEYHTDYYNIVPGSEQAGYFAIYSDGKFYAVNNVSYTEFRDENPDDIITVEKSGCNYTVKTGKNSSGFELGFEYEGKEMFISSVYPDPVEEGNTELFIYKGDNDEIRNTNNLENNEIYFNMSEDLDAPVNTLYVLHPEGTEITGKAFTTKYLAYQNGTCGSERNFGIDEEITSPFNITQKIDTISFEDENYDVAKVTLNGFYGHGKTLAEFSYVEDDMTFTDCLYIQKGMNVVVNVVNESGKTTDQTIEYIRHSGDSLGTFLFRDYPQYRVENFTFTDNVAYFRGANFDVCGDPALNNNAAPSGTGIQGASTSLDIKLKPGYAFDSIELEREDENGEGILESVLHCILKVYVNQPIFDGVIADTSQACDRVWNEYGIFYEGSSGGVGIDNDIIVKAAVTPSQVIYGNLDEDRPSGYSGQTYYLEGMIDNNLDNLLVGNYNDFKIAYTEDQRNDSGKQSLVVNIKKIEVGDHVQTMEGIPIIVNDATTSEKLDEINSNLDVTYGENKEAEKIYEISTSDALNQTVTVTIPASELETDPSEYEVAYLDGDMRIPSVMDTTYTDDGIAFTTGHFSEYVLLRNEKEKSPPTGGGGGTAVPPAEEEKSDVTVDKNTGAVDAELGSATTVKDGTAATVVGDDIAKKIVEAAVESKTDSVTVNAAAGGSVDNAEVTLSGSTVKDLADKTNADVTLKTDAGDVVLKQDALDSIAGQVSKDESVTVKLEKTETDKSVAVSASISTSTGAELDTAVDVTVNMPDSMKDKEVVVIATDKDGYKKIVTGTVNGNACTFGAEPLSGYSVILAEDLDSEAVAMSKKVTKKMVVAKTEKGNVKLTVKYTKTAKNLKNLGYKVSYKYYYSTTGKTYKAIRTSSKSSTTWSKFKKGKKYYYKYKMIVKDASGEVIYTSPLKSCTRGYMTIK